jgi:DMSO/TMAO reductase YedYZ molybdopterin-dependent catalytic subunit
MLSCCEFTGVPLKVLLEECGADLKKGKFLLAEGGDGSGMTRTINLESCLEDTIVAWGMNGEMLRPENGFPLRLVVPGVQGVSWVKWLRRLEVGDMPWNAKDEAVHYIELMPDGMHRQIKVFITSVVWLGLVEERLSALMFLLMVVITGALHVWRRRFSQSPLPASISIGLGTDHPRFCNPEQLMTLVMYNHLLRCCVMFEVIARFITTMQFSLGS